MKKQYMAPQIQSMVIQPVVMQADSAKMYAGLKGKGKIGKGYGGIAADGTEADSRFFDDWDDDEDF